MHMIGLCFLSCGYVISSLWFIGKLLIFSTDIMPLYFHRNIEQQQRSMLNYPRLPKLVYMQRAHYCGVIMDVVVSRITSHMIVCSTVYKDADQRKHQSPASLAFVRGIHRGPVDSPHKWPVTQKMFPLDDVIMWDCSPDVTAKHSRDRPTKIVILIMLFCISGPNLMIVAWMDGELLHRQSWSSKLGKILLKVRFDLEGQVRLCPKMTINQLICTFGLNLVIIICTCHKLSHGQTHDWHMDGHIHTNAGENYTWRPELALVKMHPYLYL